MASPRKNFEARKDPNIDIVDDTHFLRSVDCPIDVLWVTEKAQDIIELNTVETEQEN